MEKFSRFFQDQETIDDWCDTWAEGCAGLTGEEIKHGLSVLAKNHPWPPTMAEFRDCCKSGSKPYVPLIEPPKHGHSPHAEACMAKIREMLSHPKKAGNWWAFEVIEKAERGERVTIAALELAKNAIARQNGRRTGG